MTDDTVDTPGAADPMLEAAAMAAAAERRNRPMALIFLATAALVAAGIYATMGAVSAAEAATAADVRVRRYEQVERLAQQIERIRTDPGRAEKLETFKPDPFLRTKLNQVAADLELSNQFQIGADRREGLSLDSQMRRVVIEVTLNSVSAETGMRWIDNAVREVQGLEVATVELTPTPRGWNFKVRLGRWEISQQ